MTPRPAPIPRVALHIALLLLFHRIFSLCQTPISNECSGVLANCDHTSEWVHWVRACIRIVMRWVTLRQSLLAFPSPCAQNAILSLLIIRDWNAMGDAAKISPCVPSTCAQNAILSLLIIHIIPSRQGYMAIDNPSLVLSVSCLTTGSYLWNYLRATDDVSHAVTWQSKGCQCFSHLYKFRDRIQVTRLFWYCGERQG